MGCEWLDGHECGDVFCHDDFSFSFNDDVDVCWTGEFYALMYGDRLVSRIEVCVLVHAEDGRVGAHA